MTANFWALMQTARTAFNQGDFDAALLGYETALAATEIDLQRSDGYFERGLTHRAAGRIAPALADYRKALASARRLEWHEVRIRLFKGCAHAADHDDREAGAEFEAVQARILAPETGNDYDLPFLAAHLTGALLDITAFVDRSSRSAAGVFCRGVIKRSRGDWLGALADYQTAITLDPTSTRLREWQFAQSILMDGIPPIYAAERPPIRADIAYCLVEIDYDRRQTTITTFDRDSVSRDELPPQDGAALRGRLVRDGWIVLKQTSHKEGLSLSLARLRGT